MYIFFSVLYKIFRKRTFDYNEPKYFYLGSFG